MINFNFDRKVYDEVDELCKNARQLTARGMAGPTISMLQYQKSSGRLPDARIDLIVCFSERHLNGTNVDQLKGGIYQWGLGVSAVVSQDIKGFVFLRIGGKPLEEIVSFREHVAEILAQILSV